MDENIEFLTDNLFDSKPINDHPNGTQIKEVAAEPKSFIQRPGRTLVLCDGGFKRFEVPFLARFLKNGDIIMSHDYAKDFDYFESHIRNKIWNWMEIQDRDIQGCMHKYNLDKIMEETFDPVVWVCLERVEKIL